MKVKAKFLLALKIWIVIYPSITGFQLLFSEKLAGLELYQRTLFLTIVLVPWMVFIGLPTAELLLRLISSKVKDRKG